MIQRPYVTSIRKAITQTRFRNNQCVDGNVKPYSLTHSFLPCYTPAPRVGALSHDAHLTSVWRMTSVCLSRTSDLRREQRGIGRLKLAQGRQRHTWLGHHFQGQKVKGQHAGGGGMLWPPPARLVGSQKSNAVVTTTIWLRFDCCSTPFDCLSYKVSHVTQCMAADPLAK